MVEASVIATMHPSTIDYGDIQGIVRYGYGHLTEACFLLLRIENRRAARAWLAKTSVTTSEKLAIPPAKALQVAFTSQGLKALGVPRDIIQAFSAEFISGMAGEESRSRRLADVGASAPSRWRWGGPGNTPDVLLMLYAEDGRLEGWKQTVAEKLPEGGFQLLKCLETSDLDGHEPFGFKDGISQPKINWNRERNVDERDQLEYGNVVALGEFLLGHPNEYGKYTDRPLVAPEDDPKSDLPLAEDRPDKRDLGRNGTYVVFRELQQDVQGFWQFLDKQANSNPEERRKLAEAMVGRTISGEPLVPLTGRLIPGVETGPDDSKLNQFTYELDNAGTRCPFGAHTRRANPRNADLPAGTKGVISHLIRTLGFGHKSIRDDLIASTRFHRILRRGREYGSGLSPEDAIRVGNPDGDERGIHFICLNANISRQFEFVQNAWIIGTQFNGLSRESDPLLGNHEPASGCTFTNSFSLPRENGIRRRIADIPRFVTVRGGAYFFLPGLSALRYFVRMAE